MREWEESDFRSFYEKYFPLVYRICLLYLKNVADAEDGVQNIFLKVYERGKEFSWEEREKAWIITVTRNYCRDVMKSAWKKRQLLVGDASQYLDVGGGIISQEQSLLQEVMEMEQKYREVLYLYYYEGYSVKEMGRLLHRKESTLQTQLATGRKKLRERMMNDGKR